MKTGLRFNKWNLRSLQTSTTSMGQMSGFSPLVREKGEAPAIKKHDFIIEQRSLEAYGTRKWFALLL